MDGPQKGETRWWAVGPIWHEIKLAPSKGMAVGWFVAGGDGIPDIEVTDGRTPEPWPGEVEYHLKSTRKTRLMGDETMVAYYRKA